MLQVHDEKRALSLEPGLDHDVGFPPLVQGKITEQFFIGEFKAGRVQVSRQFRQEHFDKVDEKGGQQFLKQPVVIDHKHKDPVPCYSHGR
jgi:hypothetical protein